MKELNELVELAKEASEIGVSMDCVNPEAIFAIAEAFRALEQREEAAEAKCKNLQAACNQAEWVISGEQQNVRVLQGRESALNAEVLALRELSPKGDQEPAAWLVGGWAYHDKKSAERRSVYDNLLMEPLFTRPAPAVSLAELVPAEMIWSYHDTVTQAEVASWNACRAATLRNIEEQSQ